MLNKKKLFVFCCFILLFSACSSKKTTNKSYQSSSSSYTTATMRPYQINGITYYPAPVEVGYVESGVASWYGPGFHGKKTSNGEIYNQHSLTAAHRTFPMDTIVKVTNLQNGKVAIVRVNDRGPFAKNRIIDLSNAAAKQIDMTQKGTADVKLEVLQINAIHEFNANNKYIVQIASFGNYDNALIYKNEHHNKYGYNSKIKSNQNIHRVYLYGFNDEKNAREFVEKGFYANAIVVMEKD